MAGLISVAEAAGVREALALFSVHTATITPVSAGAEDAHGNATSTTGTPRTGVACRYRAEDRVVIDDTGRTLVSVPTLTVAHDDAIAPGHLVSNVQGSDGAVLFIGSATVEYVVPSAGLGPVLGKRAVLRFGNPG